MEVLGRLALELALQDLLRAEAEAWTGSPLGCHHDVLVEAHASAVAADSDLVLPLEARDGQVVHLCDAVVVVVVHLGRTDARESACSTRVAVIWMSLALLVRAVRRQVIEEDLLVLQDLPLQVLDRAVVRLLLGRLPASLLLPLAARLRRGYVLLLLLRQHRRLGPVPEDRALSALPLLVLRRRVMQV